MDLSHIQKAATKQFEKRQKSTGGGFQMPDYYKRQDYEVSMPSAPTAGAAQRARNVRVGARQASRTATGRALASGAYGNTSAAMLGRAADEGDAAVKAQMAGTGILENDLDRQIGVDTGNQNRAMGVAGMNMSFDEYMRNNDYRNRQLDMQDQQYKDRQRRIAEMMAQAGQTSGGQFTGNANTGLGMGQPNPKYLWDMYERLLPLM